MASQRSLPFSPSTPTVPVSQRPSQLPSSLSTVGLSTKFESVTTSRGNASNSAGKHAHTGSTVSSASRPRPSPSVSEDPSSPTRRTYQVSGRSGPTPLSGTHAHGILPPPPFFHPSHPSHQPLFASDASRRSSVASSHVPSHSHDREVMHSAFPVQSTPHDAPYDSDGHSDSFPVVGDRTSRLSMQDGPSELPMRNQKQSREPLLPISTHARSGSGSPTTTTHRSRQSLARNVVEKNAANASVGTRVRDSIERFRKGLSLESVRRSLSGSASASQSRITADLPSARSTGNAATPFEVKGSSDEDYKTLDVVPLDLRHPSPNFIPYPPTPTTKSEYPLSSVPVKHEKASGYVRNYERILSSNRWFLRGHLLMGGATPWAFLGSLALVFGTAGVWLGTTCVWWWHNKSPTVAIVAAYMCLLTISLMLSTAFKDPGILPRNLDPDPPYPSVAPSDGGDYGPLTRDLKVRSTVVTVKYCSTCRTYRPPRSNHCRVCDNCVDGCDHHCQWVNNCIGRRNYTNFFALILVITITLCFVIVTSALHLSMLVSEHRVKNFSHALGKGVGSVVAFCLAVTVVWPVGALSAYHLRVLYLNVTTIEQIRNSAHKSIVPGTAPPNPFAHSSWRGNLADILCRPGGFTWVQAHAVATEDKRLVNPGFEDQADFVVHDDGKEGGNRNSDTHQRR